MYISRIYLKNIRGFKELRLDLRGGRPRARRPRMRTVIIGENGTCKTTLLRCIAIGLCDEKDASGLLAEPIGQFVTFKEETGTIEIDLLGEGSQESVTMKTDVGSEDGQDYLKGKEGIVPNPSDELLVCGYGVGRSYEGPETGRAYRIIDSVYTMFRYDESLVGAELTLRRLYDYLGSAAFKKTMRGIKRVLGLGPKHKIEFVKGGGVTISGPKFWGLPLEGWADGYRITFGWLLDFYAWAMRAGCITQTGGIHGILLVDEPEQHLHPSMQTGLLDRLSKLFPDVQIITTTHSPLVALGASPSELVVLKRRGKKVLAATDVRDFRGYSAEDMLVDEKLFDSNAYRPETNKKLADYRRLISIPKNKRSKKQTEKLQALARDLISQQIPGIKENPLIERFEKVAKKYGL